MDSDSQLQKQMETMTKMMEGMTAQLTNMGNRDKEREKEWEAKQEAFHDRLAKMEDRLAAAPQFSTEALLDRPASMMSGSQFQQVQLEEEWKNRPVTGAEVAQIVQTALQMQVKPVVQEVYNQLDNRLAITESEVAKLKMRVAWAEKDLLTAQIQVAKRTAIFRNWPAHYTTADRQLTIREAFRAAEVSTEFLDIYTGSFKGDNEQITLSGNSIVSTVCFYDRQQLFNTHRDVDASYTACPGWKWVKVKKSKEEEEDDGNGGKKKVLKEYDDWTAEMQAQDKIKIAPGVTQMERRLEAPLFGLMNSLQRLLKKFKGQSFKPYWKSLVLTDPTGAWLGQVRYERTQLSQTSTASSQSDFKCTVYIPEELYTEVLETWSEIWFDQLAKQYSQTEDEEQALVHSSKQTAEDYQKVIRFTRHIQAIKPKWDDAQDRNVENFVQRYKWEFPWPIYFEKVGPEDPMRTSFSQLQDVSQLMKEMEEAGGMEVETQEGEELHTLTVPKEGEKERAKEEKKRSTDGEPDLQRAQKKGNSSSSSNAQEGKGGTQGWHGGHYHPAHVQGKGHSHTGFRGFRDSGKTTGTFQGGVSPY